MCGVPIARGEGQLLKLRFPNRALRVGFASPPVRFVCMCVFASEIDAAARLAHVGFDLMQFSDGNSQGTGFSLWASFKNVGFQAMRKFAGRLSSRKRLTAVYSAARVRAPAGRAAISQKEGVPCDHLTLS